ncbi:nucleoside triphosphate pyrophosphatase [Gordonia sp. CPCC 205515]|uniref:Maf family protein n=1 Tax=Gordonia sp. CPCC 205515 TaxID=3140791 RepID=UPI003AF40519
MSRRFVLASASPARYRVLRAAGIDPVVHVSDVDEDAVTAALPSGTPPAEVVRALAEAKARAVVAARCNDMAASREDDSDSVVVACDSMLLLDGRLLGKPHTAEVAAAQWRQMRGGHADLLTGHHVIRREPGSDPRESSGTSSTTVYFTDASDAMIEAYVATGEPLEVAGAFTLDGYGGWLIERIDGDPSAVIGIGLPLVATLLGRVGLAVADFWSPGTDTAK